MTLGLGLHDSRELRDLARDLESASKQNKLEAFFNSDDDVSSLDSHNESLNFIIADLTVSNRNPIFLPKAVMILVDRLHLPMRRTKTLIKFARTSIRQ
jgi:hypothetical protein